MSRPKGGVGPAREVPCRAGAPAFWWCYNSVTVPYAEDRLMTQTTQVKTADPQQAADDLLATESYWRDLVGLAVYATGYGSMSGWAADQISQESPTTSRCGGWGRRAAPQGPLRRDRHPGLQLGPGAPPVVTGGIDDRVQVESARPAPVASKTPCAAAPKPTCRSTAAEGGQRGGRAELRDHSLR